MGEAAEGTQKRPVSYILKCNKCLKFYRSTGAGCPFCNQIYKDSHPIFKVWGIRNIRAISYLLWLFICWNKFDKDTRLVLEQWRLDKFYDIWYGEV